MRTAATARATTVSTNSTLTGQLCMFWLIVLHVAASLLVIELTFFFTPARTLSHILHY